MLMTSASSAACSACVGLGVVTMGSLALWWVFPVILGIIGFAKYKERKDK